MAERAEFREIARLLGLPIRGIGVGGSLYQDDVQAVARAVGVEYAGGRVGTWRRVIERLGGQPADQDGSTGGTITQAGLQRVLDLLHSTAPLESSPTDDVQAAVLAARGEFDPGELEDQRMFAARRTTLRQGQPAFRRALLEAYEGCCAVTGCCVEEVLEAAHIHPYVGPASNVVPNGLLLRSDIHALFDRGLIGATTSPYRVRVHRTLEGSEYEALDGADLRLPKSDRDHPSEAALRAHATRLALTI